MFCNTTLSSALHLGYRDLNAIQCGCTCPNLIWRGGSLILDVQNKCPSLIHKIDTLVFTAKGKGARPSNFSRASTGFVTTGLNLRAVYTTRVCVPQLHNISCAASGTLVRYFPPLVHPLSLVERYVQPP